MKNNRLLQNARIYGWLWAALSPVLAGMALLSTVSSETAYWVQLTAFCSVAAAGLIGGISTVFRRVWGAKVLLALSFLGCLYWFGSALLGAGFALAAGRASLLSVAGFSVVIGLPGLAFVLLARGIRRQLALSRAPPSNSFKPNPLRGSA